MYHRMRDVEEMSPESVGGERWAESVGRRAYVSEQPGSEQSAALSSSQR
jgi:hypothetical protein